MFLKASLNHVFKINDLSRHFNYLHWYVYLSDFQGKVAVENL
jgi:hypothetical protein